jgi:hypothetical protein
MLSPFLQMYALLQSQIIAWTTSIVFQVIMYRFRGESKTEKSAWWIKLKTWTRSTIQV